jgi:hypothetical protein
VVENEYEPVPSEQSKACVHHWIIDAENRGVCKKCESVKQFSNWWDAALVRKAWSRNQNSAGDAVPENKG